MSILGAVALPFACSSESSVRPLRMSSGGTGGGAVKVGNSVGGHAGLGGSAPAMGSGTGGVASGGRASSGGSGGTITSMGGSGGAPSVATGGAGGTPNATGGTNNPGASGGAQSATGCANSAYLLCEDFENTAVGAIPAGWTQEGASAVADDNARHGTRALKVEPRTNGARRILHPAQGLGSKHWGRIFYRLKLPVPDAFVHSSFVAFSGIGPNIGVAEYRVVDTVKQAVNTMDVGSRYQFIFNVQPKNSAEFGTGTAYERSFDGEWHCAEWYIDASDQSYRLYWDGAEMLKFTHGAGNYADSEIPNEFGEIKVGLNNYQDAPPGFTVWIDDVAISASRVGCQ